MAKRHVKHTAPESTLLTVTNGTGSDVAAHSPIPYGDGYVLSQNPIADGASGAARGDCVANLEAKSADAWADGDDLYWDPATGELTDVAGALTKIGRARGAKAALATVADVFVSLPR